MNVTSEDGQGDHVTIEYGRSPDDPVEPEITTTIPATVVEPAVPGLEAVFVPAKIMRDLGVPLTTEALIVDPSLRRVSEADRDRVQERLGGNGEAYLEQGGQPSTGWTYLAGATALVALACAPAATIRSNRAHRLLRRVAGGSPFAVRLLTACRAALAAGCGAIPGAAAGYVIGLLLSLPSTTSADWDPPPRAPFETPWASIVLLTAALPLLAAAFALLLRPGEPR